MAFGVDTTSYLNTINWSAFYSEVGEYPVFAGRYFGGGYSWSSGEFSSAKTSTGNVLSRIYPLQASVVTRQETIGSTGYDYGVSDANATIGNIIDAIDAGQLQLGSSGLVVVYLDVETDTVLSTDYWAGWSTTVIQYYTSSLGGPWEPGVYTHYVQESNGTYSIDSDTSNALNEAPSKYPNGSTQCRGLIPMEPEPCSDCTSTAPAWPTFNTFSQAVYGNVPVYLWQYAENNGCINTCGVSNFAGGQNLDFDSSDSTGAQNYMLVIA